MKAFLRTALLLAVLAALPQLAQAQCNPACTSFTPSPTTFCIEEFINYDFYVNQTQGALSYNWTISPAGNASIVSGNGTSHVVIRLSPGNYAFNLSVVVNYSCGTSMPISQQIRVSNGLPAYPSLSQEDPNLWFNKNQAKFFINNYSSDVQYTVYNIQWANPTSPPGFSRPDFIVKGGYGNASDYQGSFYIKAENACGSVTSDTYYVDYFVGFPRSSQAETAQAYPNPASEALVLPAGVQQATLLNLQGQAVQQVRAAEQLHVQQLPAGIYTLQFYQKGKLVNQRVEVTH